MPFDHNQSENHRRRMGLVVRTTSPETPVPVYILHCKLKRRLKELTESYMEDECEKEEMIFRITTRCEKARADKELFLVFLDTHTHTRLLFTQTPAGVFSEFQRWKKLYMEVAA